MAKYSHKSMGKENGPAEVYAEPHTMKGTKLDIVDDVGLELKMPTRKNWTPLNGGVSIGHMDEVKTSGIKIRGTGCATKGVMARGPQA
jgi:hypothetical protein